MLSKRINRNFYSVLVEGYEDLVALKLLLLKSHIVLFQKKTMKDPLSSKTKILYDRIILKNLRQVFFTSVDALCVIGEHKGILIKKRIRVRTKFYIQKKFSRPERNLMQSQTIEKTFYFGFDVNFVLIGDIVDYKFIEIKQYHYNLKDKNLKEYLLSLILKHPTSCSNRIYKCPSVFVNTFNKWTKDTITWVPFKKDCLLDWRQETDKQKQMQVKLNYIYNNTSLLSKDLESLQKDLSEGNVRLVFVTPLIEGSLYNKLVEHKVKILILPITDTIEVLMPNNFIGIRYFNY
jgi:hypothetical protein